MRRIIPTAALAAIVFAQAGISHAGGLQLSTRGVRPTARGGAFVAGAEGLGSFGFNPAGLASLVTDGDERRMLLDFGFVRQSATYTRIDSGMNPQEPVTNQAPGLPIPTAAVGFDLGERAAWAVGVYAPYAGLGKYPENGPQRYSLVDLSESLLAVTELAFAYRLNDRVRLGVGVQNMVFFLASTVAFSGCPGEVACAPEDPEFDAMGKVTQLSLLNPSGVVGAQIHVTDWLRAGLAVQLPFFIRGTGKIQTRLPQSGFFDGAEVRGDTAKVSFTLPAALRAGIEVQPLPRWKAEVATMFEMWSQHEEFLIDPVDVSIENAPGVGTYEIGELRIPRHYRDTLAVNLGIEGQPSAGIPLTVLAGYSYETAAAPDEYLSVMTVDGPRHLVSAGAGYRVGVWTIDAALALVVVGDRSVQPDTGKSPQLTPIRDESDEPLEVFVNWGHYASSWLVLGAGVSRSF